MWYEFLEDQDFLTCCSVSSIVFIRLNKANRSCLLFFFCPDLFSEVHFRIPPRGGEFGDELPKTPHFLKNNFISEMHLRNQYFILKKTLFRRYISENTFFSKKNTFSKMNFRNKG